MIGRSARADPIAAEALRKAEAAGLKLAILGRFGVLAVAGVWWIASHQAWDERVLYPVFILALFFALGAAQYALIGRSWDRPWLKYLMFGLDIWAMGFVVAFGPLSLGGDVPQILAFRAYGPYYSLILLGLAALALSPGLIVWSGAMIGASWWAAFLYIVSGMERTVSWSDLPPAPSAQAYMAVFLDPDFIGRGNRVEETLFIFLTSLLLALAVHRARGAVVDHARMTKAHEDARGALGRFVPEAVVEAVTRTPHALAPDRRIGSVLFLDVRGFTALAEREPPERVFAILTAFFDAAGETLARHGGVITNIQGDALLATFNAPVPNEDHARAALSAALDLAALAETGRFADRALGVRIGVNTGPLASGSVGGARRQAFTVHGDAVNVAARLEALNKEYGTTILAGADTLTAAGGWPGARPVGKIALRGRARPLVVHAVEPSGATAQPSPAAPSRDTGSRSTRR